MMNATRIHGYNTQPVVEDAANPVIGINRRPKRTLYRRAIGTPL